MLKKELLPQPVAARLEILATGSALDYWQIPVTVLNTRTVYGREDYLVRPAGNGHGGALWVSAERVSELFGS
jgi:hypothetical protein